MNIRFSKHDAKWGKLVRERDGACRKCGKTPPYQLQAHHIMPRGRNATRLLLENGITLCAHHHTLGDDSAHRRGKDFIIEIIGQKEYRRLEKLSLQTKSKSQSIKEFNQKYL